ncbi:hypothetical protein, variant [Magnaporthiopsis poae ATCC 64411]|uniref:DUF7624 domain-containing protein n=1 Tax=Magnaporthiopsis poae (strain ATCC 64411 / 73-15) TaxID=644358 RepID=A0A0C4DT10_MAGP6|nr:hypothetical protein, variant [Magnaporthiopsis poae ATCC 64411]
MALAAPLPSTGSIISTYSPHTDMSVESPNSPAVANRKSLTMSSSAESTSSSQQGLQPHTFARPQSNFGHHLMSPISDIVGPSPVTSNGTETTEIEDEESMEAGFPGSGHPQPQLKMLKTNIPDHLRSSLNEEAVSVIHAPQSFQSWPDRPADIVSPPPSEHSVKSKSPTLSPPPISTNVKPVQYSLESATPQAQNLQDVINDHARLRSSSASSLELIPENLQGESDAELYHNEDQYSPVLEEENEIQALKTALEECWTLCNTLANLSSIHRERVFNNSGTPDAHEKAWKSCWKLCQRLYLSRDELTESHHGRTNLDLCRDFCQSLFDVRTRKDDTADSVLRVSFELNNHLYSAQDSRNLPEAFRERTLDFYITLCHRLMKQRSELAEETDSLLRACWSLAEMLFSLRQSRRDAKTPDEELLGSAVQACWELCDIFREGWTQIRPDRGTPRPSQMTFFSNSGVVASDARSNTGSRASMHSKRESLRSVPEERARKHKAPVPETPVTEFEDTPISPESSSPQMPNILVLGTGGSDAGRSGSHGPRWSSSASNLSSYSQASGKTSSTATAGTATTEDVNITRIKALIVKAAMNIGFSRDAAAVDGLGGATSLQAFVKSLPAGSFGSLPSHATLLQNYKNLVLADPVFRASASLPARNKRLNASDIGKSVGWMMHRSTHYGFLRDLFKVVFGFPLEDSETRKGSVVIVI